MIIRIILIMLMTALSVAPAANAETPLGPEEFTTVDELALAVAGYFPKVQGAVTAVQNGQVTIDLGRKDGIVPNMVLSLWREGKEILHPVTRAVIGRAEEEVGTVEVTAADEKTATAVMKRTVLEPRAGDRARTTPRKINIAVLPLRSDRPEVIEGLVERLGEIGRFSVLETQKTAAFLKEHAQRDTTLVREMGAAFALDAVVAVTVLPAEGKLLVTCRVFYADEMRPLNTIVAMLSLTSKREALGDVRPFFAPVKETGEKLPNLPVPARYAALADVDGDGAVEYVFSDGKQLSVYRIDASAWKEVWTEKVGGADQEVQQIYLGVADINRNGRSEIFVTRMLHDRISSYAAEYRDGSFQRIADIPGFIRVLTLPGRGTVLAGQDFTVEQFFSGPPKEYAWSGTAYEPGPALSVPKGLNLYSFIIANLGETTPLLVAFDEDGRLTVSNGETKLWKSEQEYHTMDTTVMKPLTALEELGKGSDYFKTAASIDKTRIVRIRGRMAAVDLNGDGVDEVLVPRNIKEQLLSGSKGGEVHGLAWNGARLDPRWSVKELSGAVLDVQAVRPAPGGTQVYALVQESGGLFGRDTFRFERFTVSY